MVDYLEAYMVDYPEVYMADWLRIVCFCLYEIQIYLIYFKFFYVSFWI
jgi:hypothetical protein